MICKCCKREDPPDDEAKEVIGATWAGSLTPWGNIVVNNCDNCYSFLHNIYFFLEGQTLFYCEAKEKV